MCFDMDNSLQMTGTVIAGLSSTLFLNHTNSSLLAFVDSYDPFVL